MDKIQKASNSECSTPSSKPECCGPGTNPGCGSHATLMKFIEKISANVMSDAFSIIGDI
jgi:hypothetical protein